MPAHSRRLTAIEQMLMRQFGQRLAQARTARRLSASAFASQLGMSRHTLRAAERGSPAVTLVTYMRILTALDLASDLALVGSVESPDIISQRKKVLEEQVAAGTRDARSLVAIPAKLAKESRVTFRKNPFGKVRSW